MDIAGCCPKCLFHAECVRLLRLYGIGCFVLPKNSRHVSIPQKSGNFVHVECVRSIGQECELGMLAACDGTLVHARGGE